jgi:hypothetical protein
VTPRTATLRIAASILILAVAAAGCTRSGDIDPSGGITAIRTACPSVAIPAGTGDITLFDPPASRLASALDLTATMTNLRSTCDDSGSDVVTQVTFDVRARRTRTDGPRDVSLPYFITVVRGGSQVVSKRVSQVALHFDAGQAIATGSGKGASFVNRDAATLSKEARETLTRKRKAGEEDAALDPLSRPEIREAVLKASFETLVGFQLTDAQLRYNATR